MLLQVMNEPLCLLYCAAILLNEKADNLKKELPNGLEIVWPELKAPTCYRGHHIAEIQECFNRRNKVLVPYESNPLLASCEESRPISIFPSGNIALQTIQGGSTFVQGIVIGERNNIRHAIVLNGDTCYDPNGQFYSIRNFKIFELWRMYELKIEEYNDKSLISHL